MNALEHLFDSRPRVRLMRLFLLNPEAAYEAKDLSGKIKANSQQTRREMQILEKAGMVKKVSFYKEAAQNGKGNQPKKKRVSGWTLDDTFPFLNPVFHLVVTSTSFKREELVKRLKNTGTIKLIVLAGIFIREKESKVDILVVGDNLKRGMVEKALEQVQADVGKELDYSLLETKEFTYRMGMYDKFLRDIFDYPHEKVIDKIGIQ